MKPFIFKLSFILSFLFLLPKAYNQENRKYGFDLANYLIQADQDQMIPLLVEGEKQIIPELIKSLGGNIRLQIGDLFSIEVPAGSIDQFAKNEAVKLIEFSSVKGQALSDTMLIQVNADSIHRAISPLNQSFSGKGVIVGIIDSGIELDHPDFQDSSGKTRILYIWDQGVPFNPSRPPNQYTYGEEWTAANIDAGISTHDDHPSQFGHGSNVTGAAASNGLAKGNFKGVAPDANIISVATDFNKPNWLQTVVEAIDYIYNKADSMGMPCVINASVGTHSGSHDGKDIAARMIDNLIKEKVGRSFVCAAGNSGAFSFHLQHRLDKDTTFTWFKNHPAQWAGLGGLFITAWGDTSDFNGLTFSIGADLKLQNGNYKFSGRTAFDSIQNRLNIIYDDSIIGSSGNRIAKISTFAEQGQGRYRLEIAIIEPDSSDYFFRFENHGTGKLDMWSSYQILRNSDMITDSLPSLSQFPDIKHYVKPDSSQTIVSSFTCLPSAITVGNYNNRNTYTDVAGIQRNMNVVPGEISVNSSLGPNRLEQLKPDLSSAGDFIFAAGRIATIQTSIITNPAKVSQDSLHFRNGGTSMASPTVAGMVALYLEKCPQANYDQIQDDLFQSAKGDALATNLPNTKWGRGKADAFQFLIRKKEIHPVVIKPQSPFCEGDTILITGSDQSLSYFWNTLDTGITTGISSAGSYYAIAYDSSGCKMKTDTVDIQFHPMPVKPLIHQSVNILLSINAQGSYQWFFDQQPIPNETNSFLIAQNTGDYYCVLTDSIGCSVNSDTIQVIITGIEELKKNPISYKLNPNPSKGSFSIRIDPKMRLNRISAYGLDGKLVHFEDLNSEKQQFDFNWSHLNSGLYLLKLDFNTISLSDKLIIK